MPISLVVILLLIIVTASYRQTLYAYPNGGGSYIVSRENLGTGASLVAAASLMVDYTLTVAVSIAAGVAAITSAVTGLQGYEVELCLVLLALIALANLRGVRESGRLFAPPTYTYIVMMTLLVVVGLIGVATGSLGRLPVDHKALEHFTGAHALLAGASSFLLLRAFSSGAVALSGVEAISNGIQAFRKPESRNAAITLIWVAVILGTLFLGIAVLASHLRPTLSPDQTLLSIMGREVFGDGALYVLLQVSTAAILTLSANTAFADFPRLSGIVASDEFLPRQFANRGDRLVLSNGILVLMLAAGILLFAFGGEVSALIPLFAVGLFMSFTLSQSGMVVHHWRGRAAGMGPPPGGQCRGRARDRGGDDCRRRLEVHRRSLGSDARDTAARPSLLVDPPPLPSGRRRARVPAGHAASRDRAHRRRAGAGPSPCRSARVARLREVAPAALPARGPRRVRRRRGRADARHVERVRLRRGRSTSCLPPTAR